MIIIQLAIVLLALYVGSRYGSITLGVISGIGLAILVFAFGLKPGTPPTDVIYIIIAAVTCAGVLQASGGMDFMIQIAEKFLRAHPERITFYAPFYTFFLTVLVGTGHVVYTLMPIIADISLKKGRRPERPCAVASVASQVGITCSPIAAAVVSFVTITNTKVPEIWLTIPQVLMITIPACLCGIFAAAVFSSKRGLDLDKDPKYQARLADPELKDYMFGSTATTLDKQLPATAKASVFMFLAALAVIVILATFPTLLPHYDGKPLKMNLVIQIVMLTVAGLMVLTCKAEPKKVVSGSVWQAGMVAVVAIYGIAWLSDTYFVAYKGEMMTAMKDIVNAYPWAIAFVLFAVSVLINTQGGVVLAIMPLAYDLGIPWYVLLGVLPSVYGYFFIPNYPSDIATVNFDRSGTTIIGKYLLNHSFMIPGLISVTVSCIIGYLLANIVY